MSVTRCHFSSPYPSICRFAGLPATGVPTQDLHCRGLSTVVDCNRIASCISTTISTPSRVRNSLFSPGGANYVTIDRHIAKSGPSIWLFWAVIADNAESIQPPMYGKTECRSFAPHRARRRVNIIIQLPYSTLPLLSPDSGALNSYYIYTPACFYTAGPPRHATHS